MGEPVSLPVPLEEIHSLLGEAASDESGLALLKGFKLDFSGNKDFHKVFFSVSCKCGTAALLSVEISRSKTLPEIEESLPSLVGHLKSRAQQFKAMPCEMHTQMRTGGQPVQPPG